MVFKKLMIYCSFCFMFCLFTVFIEVIYCSWTKSKKKIFRNAINHIHTAINFRTN